MGKSLIPLPKGKLGKAVEEAQRKENALQRLKAKSKTEALAVLTTGEVCASSFAMGLLHNKYGSDHKLVGVKTPLLIGAVAKLAAVSGLAGAKNSHHLHAIGNGCLAVQTYILGRETTLKDSKGKSFQGIDLLPDEE